MTNPKLYTVRIPPEALFEAMKQIAKDLIIAEGRCDESEIVGFCGGQLIQGVEISVIIQPADDPYR